MGEFIVKDGFESLVNRFVDAAGVPKPDGRGDVLRLDMEGRRMGNPKLDGDFFSFDREGEGHEKMHHLGPADGLFQRGFVGTGKAHALRLDQAVENGHPEFPDGIFVLPVFPRADDPDLVAMPPQGVGETAGGYGGAVVIVVELIDNQQDFHTGFLLTPPFWRIQAEHVGAFGKTYQFSIYYMRLEIKYNLEIFGNLKEKEEKSGKTDHGYHPISCGFPGAFKSPALHISLYSCI